MIGLLYVESASSPNHSTLVASSPVTNLSNELT